MVNNSGNTDIDSVTPFSIHVMKLVFLLVLIGLLTDGLVSLDFTV